METLKTKDYASIKNQGTISLQDVPVIQYAKFTAVAEELLKSETRHCVNYYAYPFQHGLKFIFCVADDVEQSTGHLDRGDAAATFDGSLSDVVGGLQPGRIAAEDRIALIFSGTGLADVAAAAAVYRRARERGLGRMLDF